jgi:hypothetical protein
MPTNRRGDLILVQPLRLEREPLIKADRLVFNLRQVDLHAHVSRRDEREV